MGFYVQYRCKCSYVTPEDLGDVEYVCSVCKEVISDSLVNQFSHHGFPECWNELFKNLKQGTVVCPNCHKGILKKWDYTCPKCGNSHMEWETTGSFF